MKFSWALFLFLTALSLITAAKPAEAVASSYPPASLGYVYEECKKSLNLTSYEEFRNSYCGRYTTGYMSGLLRSNWIIPVRKEGPCSERIDLEFKKILWSAKSLKADRFVPTLPSGLQFLLAIGDSIAKNDPRLKEKLHNTTREWASSPEAENSFIGLKEKYQNTQLIKNIDPKTLKQSFEKGSSTIEEMYNLCKKDYVYSNGNPNIFSETLCGAEMEGQIAGLLSNHAFVQNEKKLIEGKNSTDTCDVEALAIYKNIDVSTRECVSPTTQGADIARIFIELVENKSQLPTDYNSMMTFKLSDFGTLGYLITYHDYMCNPSKRGILQSGIRNNNHDSP